ncbi:cytochrome P450 [Streptomyces sp. NPDC052496]|uniref:cytochrome P450 n=1 Tax=Streptomyces sp. NPDC052496 TaxID=3154951 RepID=UPI003438D66F
MNLRRPVLDSTVPLLTQGYAWLPDRRRRTTAPVVRARLMGRPAVALHGPEAVPFFYDEHHVHRHGALPGPVLSTLFGHGAVHTLDGEPHRVRKALFLSLLKDSGGVEALAERVREVWDETATAWPGRSRVVLFDEVSAVLTRAVCRWAGVPMAGTEAQPVARDLVAMVDGFATAGPRHWRARAARRRQEAWLAQLFTDVRDGTAHAPAGSAVHAVAHHRDADGERLDPRTAAVELLNVIRPTVAVTWFVTFAAHALHRRPQERSRLLKEGPAYAEAFAHEVRRFYPFAPFTAGLAARELTWQGERIPEGALVLLDLYGQNHDSALWPDPYVFDPGRFLDHPPGRDDLVPQGGDDPATGHRCPGEDVTVALLRTTSERLAALEYDVPEQDLRIPLHRIPARVRSGFVISGVRTPV